jgi:predicted exporter
LLAVGLAVTYLAWRAVGGIELKTDLMALLPQEERDASIQRAKLRMSDVFGQRIVLLVGHNDRATARKAGADVATALQQSGMTVSVQYQTGGADARLMGEVFFAHRAGLLTAQDRARLSEGRAHEVVNRTLATLFGPVGIVDAKMLQRDPFLLTPAYLAALPLPLSRVSVDDGMFTVSENGKTYVVITAQLNGDVFTMSYQENFVSMLDEAVRRVESGAPGVSVLRSGAVFYAHAAATVANRETTVIGLASTLATFGLILIVFRALRPLWFNVLALTVGVTCAFSASLWLFGALHVGALLFGVSLIGVAVDYSLHYVCEGLGDDTSPGDRIWRVLPGITLGLITTLIGYLALLLAPFPGLHQLAVFSVVGLCASFLTVVLWLPLLDHEKSSRHATIFLIPASIVWRFWEEKRYRPLRSIALVGLAALGGIGAMILTVDDDVRRLQNLPDGLRQQEADIRRLVGSGSSSQFFLVTGADQEQVLQREEQLLDSLGEVRAGGAITQIYALAQIVPSQMRQRENRALVQEKLVVPHLPNFYRRVGLSEPTERPYSETSFLTADAIGTDSALSFFRNLVIQSDAGATSHLVLLDGVVRLNDVRRATEGLPGVRLVDPTGDFSRLLGEYRRRAIILLALSAVFMMPVLLWRYGFGGALRVLLPTAIALVLTPPLVALGGAPFTFFNAIALLLVLAISIDYAIFCREAHMAGRAATMLGICLATLTTILSFGLLALSSVYGVHAFGMTLAVGISLAFLLSPLAGNRASAVLGQNR